MVKTRPHVSLASKVLYLEVSSKASGLLYPTKRSGAFLQKREPDAIAALLQNRFN